jgi:hypothetical protein
MNNNIPYTLPIIKRYMRTKKEIFWLILGLGIFISLAFLLDEIYIQIILTALAVYSIFANIFLKPILLEVTDTKITISSRFRKKIVFWDEIADIELIHTEGNALVKRIHSIGIILKKDIISTELPFALRLIIILFKSSYSVNIPLEGLQDIDPERLLYTMRRQFKLEAQVIEDFDTLLNEIENNKIYDETPIRAFIYAFIISIFMGLLQGFLLYLSTKDYLSFLSPIAVFVPILASIWIVHIFHDKYREKKYNFLSRLVLSTDIIILIALGIISNFYFVIGKYPTVQNIERILHSLSRQILRDPIQLHIIMGIISIYLIITHGYNPRLLKKLKKWLFWGKNNNYYSKVEDDLYTVYLIDPEEIDDEYEERFRLEIREGCLIEKDRRKPLSFYILMDHISEYELQLPSDNYIDIDDKRYFCIDLKERVSRNPEPYFLSCWIEFDRNKQVKMLHFKYLK